MSCAGQPSIIRPWMPAAFCRWCARYEFGSPSGFAPDIEMRDGALTCNDYQAPQSAQKQESD